MDDASIIEWAIGIAASLAGATAAALLMGLVVSGNAWLSSRRHLWVIPLMGLGSAVATMMSGRDLRFANELLDASATFDGGDATQPLRLLTGVLLLLAVGAVLSEAFGHHRRRTLAASLPALLLGSYVAFLLGNSVLNGLFGTVPAFAHNVLWVPIALLTLYIARHQPWQDVVRWAKAYLFLAAAAGFLSAVIRPDFAVQPYPQSVIPGVTIRFWGIGSSPNSTGPLALLLLTLEYLVPCTQWYRRWLVWIVGGAAFVLAQSKTTWVAAVLMAVFLVAYRDSAARSARSSYGAWLWWCVGGLVVAAVSLAVGLSSALADLDPEVQTLTGRTQIWDAAWQMWRASPLFGYGPSAWGVSHRLSIGMPFAVSAHNQFLQSLSAAGLLGVLTLLFHVAVLAFAMFRIRKETRGVSLALLCFLLARCTTEAPLVAGTLFNGDVLTQALLLHLAWSIRPTDGKAASFDERIS